ncbi:hypothetical protein M0802_011795 [Mischocyttarus mexicanus]|nr:hypothetical protein M0802_011795 [Mischocyttarus mexicanus]
MFGILVDTWRSHDEKKICPQCKKEVVPALHTRRHKLTTSHMTATCLLGCWPFCFIPLMKRSKKIRMICPACGYVYGTYEYKNNNLAPCQRDSENSQVRLPCTSSTSFRVKSMKEEETCWPLCLVPLMLSQERQARLVCPFCGHNYRNYPKSENKSDGSSLWHARGGQQRLVEIMTSKLNPPNEGPALQPNSELSVIAYQELWEVQDASQQTTDNGKEKEKEVVIKEEDKEDEEEEEEEERDASVPKVFQNLSRETTSQHSEVQFWIRAVMDLDTQHWIQGQSTFN